jgi:hypothetical protein
MKIIRFALILYLLTLIGETASAQNLKLSDEPGQFMVQFRKLMDGSRNPQYISARRPRWIASGCRRSVLRSKRNSLVSLKHRSQRGKKQGLCCFLLTRNTHSFAKQSPENLDGFPESRNHFRREIRRKDFAKVLETVRSVHETNKLYAANYNSLYLLSGTYQYRFDTTNAVVPMPRPTVAAGNDSWNTPIDSNYVIAPKSNPLPIIAGAMLDLQNATFAMVAGGDSVVFGPANGSVSLKDGIFVGKNGKFNWQAAGDSTIYADLDSYSFNISQPKLVAENVTLHDERQLAAPIKGTLEYRGVKKIKGQPVPYPRFVSNTIDARLKENRKNIDYKGGFALIGTKMYSSSLSDELSTIKVKYKDQLAFKALSKKFVLEDSVFHPHLPLFQCRLGADSVYHPGVTLKYNDDEGLVKLGRVDKTDYAPLPYKDSYHKMNIWSQAMRWRFPTLKVEFLRIDGKTGGSGEPGIL